MNLLILFKVSLLLSVALVAARLLSRVPAATRHGFWSLAFGAVLLLAPLAAALPAIYVPVPAGWKADASTQIAPAATASTTNSRPGADVRQDDPVDASWSAGPVSSAVDQRQGASIFFVAWLAGVIAATLSVLVSLCTVRRLARTAEVVSDPVWAGAATAIGERLGLRYPVRLLVSARVSTPMAGGVWRPAVFLPLSASTWSAEHRDLVLAHELAHLAGRDPLRHLLTRLALACYWFHPLAWIAAREAAIAREQACDEAVLAIGARPSAYARVLLDLAESISAQPRARFLGALPMVHRSNLEKRLMAILNVDARPATRRRVLAPAIGVALLTLSVAAAQPALSQEKPVISAGEIARLPEEKARPFAENPARPSAEPHARPVAETLAAASLGAPIATAPAAPMPAGPVDDAPSAQGRESACLRESANDTDRIIQRSFGDLRLCMVAEGVGDRNNVERPSQWIGRAPRVVMEAHRGNTVQRLELTGSRTSWQVDGSTRDFNAAGQTWRDRMLAVLDTTWEVSSLRGEVSGLRGQISALQGQRSALEGEISALQGVVSAMEGRLSTALGEESRLRGEISAIQGHVSTLQGKISAERGAISRLQSSRYRVIPLDPGMVDFSVAQRERNRIETQITDHETEIARIQRQIRDYGAETRIAAVQREIESFGRYTKTAALLLDIRNLDLAGKVAAVRGQIAALDVDGRVAGIERQIEALDADRRARQLEDRLDTELPRLTSAIAAIR